MSTALVTPIAYMVMPSSWADWASVRVVSASMLDSPVSKVRELLHTDLPYTVEE